jgi:hypothetical protein
MAKIKVVQVMPGDLQVGVGDRLVDDKGRIWYKDWDAEQTEYIWKQVELPEDPDDEDMPF